MDGRRLLFSKILEPEDVDDNKLQSPDCVDLTEFYDTCPVRPSLCRVAGRLLIDIMGANFVSPINGVLTPIRVELERYRKKDCCSVYIYWEPVLLNGERYPHVGKVGNVSYYWVGVTLLLKIEQPYLLRLDTFDWFYVGEKSITEGEIMDRELEFPHLNLASFLQVTREPFRSQLRDTNECVPVNLYSHRGSIEGEIRVSKREDAGDFKNVTMIIYVAKHMKLYPEFYAPNKRIVVFHRNGDGWLELRLNGDG